MMAAGLACLSPESLGPSSAITAAGTLGEIGGVLSNLTCFLLLSVPGTTIGDTP